MDRHEIIISRLGKSPRSLSPRYATFPKSPRSPVASHSPPRCSRAVCPPASFATQRIPLRALSPAASELSNPDLARTFEVAQKAERATLIRNTFLLNAQPELSDWDLLELVKGLTLNKTPILSIANDSCYWARESTQSA
jgi:hypothetical protein